MSTLQQPRERKAKTQMSTHLAVLSQHARETATVGLSMRDLNPAEGETYTHIYDWRLCCTNFEERSRSLIADRQINRGVVVRNDTLVTCELPQSDTSELVTTCLEKTTYATCARRRLEQNRLAHHCLMRQPGHICYRSRCHQSTMQYQHDIDQSARAPGALVDFQLNTHISNVGCGGGVLRYDTHLRLFIKGIDISFILFCQDVGWKDLDFGGGRR